jgi:hypothetical protein
VKRLVALNPEALSTPDADGYLPVNLAVENLGIEIFDFLIDAYPRAAEVEHHPNLLSKALRLGYFSDMEDVLRHNHTRFPHLERAPCDHFRGSLPLHIVCKRPNYCHVVKYIYNCYPEAVKVKDLSGKLPLRYILEGVTFYRFSEPNGWCAQSLRLILKAYPEAANISDGTRTPYETAVRGDAPKYVRCLR